MASIFKLDPLPNRVRAIELREAGWSWRADCGRAGRHGSHDQTSLWDRATTCSAGRLVDLHVRPMVLMQSRLASLERLDAIIGSVEPDLAVNEIVYGGHGVIRTFRIRFGIR